MAPTFISSASTYRVIAHSVGYFVHAFLFLGLEEIWISALQWTDKFRRLNQNQIACQIFDQLRSESTNLHRYARLMRECAEEYGVTAPRPGERRKLLFRAPAEDAYRYSACL